MTPDEWLLEDFERHAAQLAADPTFPSRPVADLSGAASWPTPRLVDDITKPRQSIEFDRVNATARLDIDRKET